MSELPLVGPSAEEQFLELSEISKSYGQQAAVSDVELHIRRGEFITLLGPSGCGKTTLLRIISGMIAPSSGAVRFKGQDVTRMLPERRPFNMVFQSYALFPHMTVAENVAYGPETIGLRREEVRERVGRMLELVRMDELGNRRVTELSGGQQQRVALARALVLEPEVLLLDEPLAALDLQLRKRLRDELRATQERVRTTFVFVTHDQEEALSLSDRVCLMNEGRVIQTGTPREVYQRPNSRFVAEFVGETNLLDCEVVACSSERATVRLGTGVTLELPCFARSSLQVGEAATVVIRPEHLEASVAGQADFAGTVERSIFFGTSVRLDVALESGQRISVLTPASKSIEPGAKLHLELIDGASVVR